MDFRDPHRTGEKIFDVTALVERCRERTYPHPESQCTHTAHGEQHKIAIHANKPNSGLSENILAIDAAGQKEVIFFGDSYSKKFFII